MPELPEAETIARGLARCLKDKTIRKVAVRVPALRRPLSLRKLRRDAKGRKVTAVRRRDKAIIVELSGRRAILLQLGMTGACRVCSAKEPLRKHEHVIFALSRGRSWRFKDARRFGMVESFRQDNPKAVPEFLRRLGPEPLADGFDGEYLYGTTRKRKRSTKQLLVDQRFVAGIGNIYACELLFRASVRPTRAARRLTKKDCRRIIEETRAVLGEAIAAGGTTVSDYTRVDGKEGDFRPQLRVYGRKGEPCVTCNTPIKRVVQCGRATYYCPTCQK